MSKSAAKSTGAKAQGQMRRAIDEGAAAVERTLAGASRRDIHSALVIELHRRGVADFEPSKDLIDRIRRAGT